MTMAPEPDVKGADLLGSVCLFDAEYDYNNTYNRYAHHHDDIASLEHLGTPWEHLCDDEDRKVFE